MNDVEKSTIEQNLILSFAAIFSLYFAFAQRIHSSELIKKDSWKVENKLEIHLYEILMRKTTENVLELM